MALKLAYCQYRLTKLKLTQITSMNLDPCSSHKIVILLTISLFELFGHQSSLSIVMHGISKICFSFWFWRKQEIVSLPKYILWWLILSNWLYLTQHSPCFYSVCLFSHFSSRLSLYSSLSLYLIALHLLFSTVLSFIQSICISLPLSSLKLPSLP